MQAKDGAIYGMLSGLTAFLLFGAINVMNKYLYMNTKITPTHIAYWGGLSLFFCNLAICIFSKVSLFDVKKEDARFLMLRALFGSIGSILTTLLFSLLTLTKGQAIFFTYPIWASVNAYIFLKEKLSKYDIIAIISAFLGVLLIIFNPFTGAKGDSADKNTPLGVISGILGTLSFSLGDLCVRVMPNVPATIIPAYLGLLLAIFSGTSLLIEGNNTEILTSYTLVPVSVMTIIGIVWVASYFFLTKAFQLEKAGRIALLTYSQMLVAAFTDLVIFGASIHFLDLIGIVLIVGSNFAIVLLKFMGVIQS